MEEKINITLASSDGTTIHASTTEGIEAAFILMNGLTHASILSCAGHMSHGSIGQILATVQDSHITSVSTNTVLELVRNKIALNEWCRKDMVETIMAFLRSDDPINQQTARKLNEMWNEVEPDKKAMSVEDVVLQLLVA